LLCENVSAVTMLLLITNKVQSIYLQSRVFCYFYPNAFGWRYTGHSNAMYNMVAMTMYIICRCTRTTKSDNVFSM